MITTKTNAAAINIGIDTHVVITPTDVLARGFKMLSKGQQCRTSTTISVSANRSDDIRRLSK